MSFTHMSVP